MNCVVCHHGHTRPGLTTVTFHGTARMAVVNEVPAAICDNCGEAYVDDDITVQVLAIGAEARRAKAQVLVRDFTPA